MNEDLISRSVLRKCFAEQCPGDCSSCDCCSATNGKLFCGLIDDAPAIDAVPVRHGKWIYNPNANDWGIGGYVCSECSAKNGNLPSGKVASPMVFVGSKFCPNCGARMDEGGSGDGQTQD